MKSDEALNSQNLLQRVSRLEKRSRLPVRLSLLLVLLICLMLLAGWKSYRQAMSGVVECRSLAVKDVEGHTRARLSVKGDEATLQFYDSRGRVLWSDPPQDRIMPAR